LKEFIAVVFSRNLLIEKNETVEKQSWLRMERNFAVDEKHV
jgi:hypothetical protein